MLRHSALHDRGCHGYIYQSPFFKSLSDYLFADLPKSIVAKIKCWMGPVAIITVVFLPDWSVPYIYYIGQAYLWLSFSNYGPRLRMSLSLCTWFGWFLEELELLLCRLEFSIGLPVYLSKSLRMDSAGALLDATAIPCLY